jgi:hypothetical protein
VEPKAGKHFTFPTPNRSAPELASVLNRITGSYPYARTIYLVMDNLNIHCRKPPPITSASSGGGYLWDRLTVHYTSTHGSWLNQAEIEISLFARQCLGKRRSPTLGLLQLEAHAWNRKVNRDKVKIDWRFSRTRKLARSSDMMRTRSGGQGTR